MSEKEEACKLCDRQNPLRDSHIIPAYVFRWIKDTSPNGHLRISKSINKRVQDGFKEKLLCDECEELFSRWENRFKIQFFDAATMRKARKINYDQNTSRFIASVLWRILASSHVNGLAEKLPPKMAHNLSNAQYRWKNFLLGTISNYGEFTLHLFDHWQLFDAQHTDLPGNWNRYLARYVEFDFPLSKDAGFAAVYAKLGPISLFGHLTRPKHNWRGTRINPSSGRYDSEKVSLPSYLFEYYRHRAAYGFQLANSVSSQQSEKIDFSLRENIDRFVASPSFEELQRDAKRFGSKAIWCE